MTRYVLEVGDDAAYAGSDYTAFHTFLDGFLMGAGVEEVERKELRQRLPKIGCAPSLFMLPDGRTVQYWKEEGAVITTNVDLTERSEGRVSKGVVLLTGEHGFPKPPQGILSRSGTGWTLSDDYGDPDRNGRTRPDFFEVAGTRNSVLRKWFRHLGIDPEDVKVETHPE